MTQDDLSFLPLRVTRVGVGGKRSFDPVDKLWLIEACLQPGASLSGLALKAGVNANQLHKWVRQHEQSNTTVRDDTAVGSSAFVPVVVAINGPAPVLAATPAARPVPEREPIASVAAISDGGAAVGPVAQRREARARMRGRQC